MYPTTNRALYRLSYRHQKVDLGGVESPALSTQNAEAGAFRQAHKTQGQQVRCYWICWPFRFH